MSPSVQNEYQFEKVKRYLLLSPGLWFLRFSGVPEAAEAEDGPAMGDVVALVEAVEDPAGLSV